MLFVSVDTYETPHYRMDNLAVIPEVIGMENQNTLKIFRIFRF